MSPATPGATAPADLDYDALESLDYERYVRPLLASRDVLAASGASGSPAYDLERVTMAGPSGFIVPYDCRGKSDAPVRPGPPRDGGDPVSEPP